MHRSTTTASIGMKARKVASPSSSMAVSDRSAKAPITSLMLRQHDVRRFAPIGYLYSPSLTTTCFGAEEPCALARSSRQLYGVHGRGPSRGVRLIR